MRTLRLPLLLALVAALVLGAPGAGTSAGSALTEVVVTFNGEGAFPADVDALEAVGITTAITFRALPIAGALATPAQVDALAASPQVASVYPNSALTYDNATSTNLTGVDAVRADAKLTKKNGNLPVAGHGVTVLVQRQRHRRRPPRPPFRRRTSSRTSRRRRTCTLSRSSPP